MSIRRHLLLIAFLLAGASPALHAHAKGAPAPTAEAKADGLWIENLEAAKKDAAKEKKDILMDFTGSDWCGWCQKLKGEVFDTEAFRKEGAAKFVLLELDFPRGKKQSPEITQQNAALAQIFGIQGFPTILLADAQGRPYAQTGYQPGGPEAYLATLEKLSALRVARDAKFAEAEKATGAAKAKLLDEGLTLLKNDAWPLTHYESTVAEIVKLDADGSAGLKAKWGEKLKSALANKKFNQEMRKIMPLAKDKPGEAVKQLEGLGADLELGVEQRQQALAIASRVCQLGLKDEARAIKLFDAAVALAPESQLGKMLAQARSKAFAKDGAAPTNAPQKQEEASGDE